MKLSLHLGLLLATIAVGGAASAAAGTSAWFEGFEGPQPSWRPADGNVHYRIDRHERVQGQAHTGNGCELLVITGDSGSELLFSYNVGQPVVIDELMPTVWIRSDRPGMQLLVRIVLPRSLDPQTGQALSMTLRGTSYTTPGRWQQLRIDDLTTQVTRQTWTLRTQQGPQVDPREAYVDAVLLNVYGGPGTTSVWIDDLDIAGYVTRAGGAAAAPGPDANRTAPATPAPVYGRLPAAPGADSGRRRHKIEQSGRAVMVDGRPMFPRAIQYQGEPLGLLRQLGFNTVWLTRLPTAEMMEEAAQLGLWLVSPPPAVDGGNPAGSPPVKIGPAYDCVLAWDLGRGLGERQLMDVRRWAEQVRAVDPQGGRPLICQPTSQLRPYSNIARLLLIGRGPLASSLELNDYGTWVRQRPWLAVPGTPVWTTIQTQPSPSLRQQWRGLGVEEAMLPGRFSPEQVRLLVYSSATAGSRGLLFESYTSLAGADPETRIRAMTLELMNLELDLIEPWMAAGNFVTTVPSSEPGLIGALLQAERARILVPLWTEPGSQMVSGQAAGNGTSFTVPGVPEGNSAYDILPGGLRPVRDKRVTGGTRVMLDEFSLSALILFTQDALVVNDITQRAARIGQRAAQLVRELAMAKLQLVQQIESRLPAREPAASKVEWFALARKDLEACDRLLAARNYRDAYAYADRAMRPLRLVERSRWESAVAPMGSAVASPAAVLFAALPAHWKLMERLRASSLGENRLAGGDFEDLGAMRQCGWNHFTHPVDGVVSEVNLDPRCAHGGQYGLCLAARPVDPKNPPAMIESPPCWIASPAVPVQAGELISIQGWVHIPSPITGSVDGLLIVDSLGGEALAERIGETTGWRFFSLYRVAPESGPMSVSFALSGMGEAWLDDVRLSVVGSRAGVGAAAAGPPALPSNANTTPLVPNTGPLPVDRSRIAPVTKPSAPGRPGR